MQKSVTLIFVLSTKHIAVDRRGENNRAWTFVWSNFLKSFSTSVICNPTHTIHFARLRELHLYHAFCTATRTVSTFQAPSTEIKTLKLSRVYTEKLTNKRYLTKMNIISAHSQPSHDGHQYFPVPLFLREPNSSSTTFLFILF